MAPPGDSPRCPPRLLAAAARAPFSLGGSGVRAGRGRREGDGSGWSQFEFTRVPAGRRVVLAVFKSVEEGGSRPWGCARGKRAPGGAPNRTPPTPRPPARRAHRQGGCLPRAREGRGTARAAGSGSGTSTSGCPIKPGKGTGHAIYWFVRFYIVATLDAPT